MREINLDLGRAEGTRRSQPVIKFELNEILQHFNENIEAINAQFLVADELVLEGKLEDGKNIWRSQIVFLESAFDFYMHEITKYGLGKIFDGDWKATEKYKNIKVKMEIVEEALKDTKNTNWFSEFVNRFYISVTMVSFDSVKQQMNLLGIKIQEVANGAFWEPDSTEKTRDKLKRRLKELFERRNLIAHQSDREHTNAKKKDISKEIVKDWS